MKVKKGEGAEGSDLGKVCTRRMYSVVRGSGLGLRIPVKKKAIGPGVGVPEAQWGIHVVGGTTRLARLRKKNSQNG